MRRITFAALGTVSSLVMIFAYPTSHNASVTGTTAVASTEATTTDSSTATSVDDDVSTESATTSDDESSAAAATSSSTGTAIATSSAVKTYTGDAVQTQWGIVQVQITVKNGKVTAAQAIQHPTGGKNDQINAYAVPILNSEAVAAQSANIDAVSGATVTSNGYTTSLQSALDAATR